MSKQDERSEYIKNLIEQCLQGNHTAWDELIKALNPFITSIVMNKFRKLGFHHQKSDLENVKQEIFLSISKKNGLAEVKEKNKAISWIFAISINAASNYVRNHRVRNSSTSELKEDLAKDYLLTPAEELFNKDLQDDIKCALETLKPKEQLVIKLHLIYGKSHKEISSIMNTSIGTILACAYRAKLKLRKKLKKYAIK